MSVPEERSKDCAKDRLGDAPKRVEVVGHEIVYRGFFRVDRYQLRHDTYAGGLSPVLTREVFERGNAAAVLLYDPDADSVALVEQFRPGAHAAGMAPWLLEAVAGMTEAGEEAGSVALREAREEAGAEVADLEEIGTFILSPGGCSERVTIFCGRVDSRKLGGIHGLAEEGEDIAVRVLSLDRALAMIGSGEICTAVAVIPLQWLALNRARLRASWGPPRS